MRGWVMTPTTPPGTSINSLQDVLNQLRLIIITTRE